MAPRNFHCVEAVRHETYFGSGALRLCGCKARSTGRPCQNPAVKGRKACRVHGGTGGRNSLDKTPGRGCKPDVQYFASVAFSEALNDVLAKYPAKTVAEIERIEFLGARGRAIHALVNGKIPEK